MKNFIIGGLAVAGGLYLAKSATCYVLTKYKKEIREYVIDKVIGYFFTDEDGEEINEDELIMAAINSYLKKKGANK